MRPVRPLHAWKNTNAMPLINLYGNWLQPTVRIQYQDKFCSLELLYKLKTPWTPLFRISLFPDPDPKPTQSLSTGCSEIWIRSAKESCKLQQTSQPQVLKGTWALNTGPPSKKWCACAAWERSPVLPPQPVPPPALPCPACAGEWDLLCADQRCFGSPSSIDRRVSCLVLISQMAQDKIKIYKGRRKAKECVVATDTLGRVLALPVFTCFGESFPVLQNCFHAVLVFLEHPGAHATLSLVKWLSFCNQ